MQIIKLLGKCIFNLDLGYFADWILFEQIRFDPQTKLNNLGGPKAVIKLSSLDEKLEVWSNYIMLFPCRCYSGVSNCLYKA